MFERSHSSQPLFWFFDVLGGVENGVEGSEPCQDSSDETDQDLDHSMEGDIVAGVEETSGKLEIYVCRS
jgi:hypothetical protein